MPGCGLSSVLRQQNPAQAGCGIGACIPVMESVPRWKWAQGGLEPLQSLGQAHYSPHCPCEAVPGSGGLCRPESVTVLASAKKGNSRTHRAPSPCSPAAHRDRQTVSGWALTPGWGLASSSCPLWLPRTAPGGWHRAGPCPLPCPPSAHRQAARTKTAASLFFIISVTACNGAEKL